MQSTQSVGTGLDENDQSICYIYVLRWNIAKLGLSSLSVTIIYVRVKLSSVAAHYFGGVALGLYMSWIDIESFLNLE